MRRLWKRTEPPAKVQALGAAEIEALRREVEALRDARLTADEVRRLWTMDRLLADEKARRERERMVQARASALLGPTDATPPPMAALVEELCAGFGLSQDRLAPLLGCAPRTIPNWKRAVRPQARHRQAAENLWRLLRGLRLLLEPSEIPRWLHEPNEALGGAAPVDLLRRGRSDLVWRELHAAMTGQPH